MALFFFGTARRASQMTLSYSPHQFCSLMNDDRTRAHLTHNYADQEGEPAMGHLLKTEFSLLKEITRLFSWVRS